MNAENVNVHQNNGQVPKYTTADDLLVGYSQKDVTLSTGKVFQIQSFSPGSLLINLGSPLVDALTDMPDADLSRVPLETAGTRANTVWQEIKRIVCDNVISVTFVAEPQSSLPTGYVSLSRLSNAEIQELYRMIRDLSVPEEELELFRKIYEEEQGTAEPAVANENSEDSVAEQA